MIAQQLNYYFYRDPEFRDSVQALEDFYYAKIDENIGKLRAMEEKKHDVFQNITYLLRTVI